MNQAVTERKSEERDYEPLFLENINREISSAKGHLEDGNFDRAIAFYESAGGLYFETQALAMRKISSLKNWKYRSHMVEVDKALRILGNDIQTAIEQSQPEEPR